MFSSYLNLYLFNSLYFHTLIHNFNFFQYPACCIIYFKNQNTVNRFQIKMVSYEDPDLHSFHRHTESKAIYVNISSENKTKAS